jgi:uroporphyrinogen decarboxylase
MRPRDYILEQIRHHETRPVPYTLCWEGDVGERLDRHYGNAAWRGRIQPFIVGTGVVDTMRKRPTDQPGITRDLYGSLWRMDQRPFHLARPALAEPSLDGYRWPAPEEFFATGEWLANAKRCVDEAVDRHFTTAGLGWGLFESSWGIRGFEDTLVDSVAYPEFYEEFLDRLTDQFLAFVDYTCRELPRVDAIMFGDDWGDQRQYHKPRWKKIYDRVHGYGKLAITHCCGSIVDIIPDAIEIGLDVLESCQPEAHGMNPYELKKKFGDKLTFWGCLGAQSTVPFGTPDEIRAEVARLVREMGRGGGFILAPAKPMQPETPTANAAAVFESFTQQEGSTT